VSHGELATIGLTLDDGYRQLVAVIVEIKRVPKSRRRRLLNRLHDAESGKRTGYAAMRPADYILTYGIEPWQGSTRRPTRTETVH
jgi:hypothetical protein